MSFLFRLIINSLAVFIAAYVLPGVHLRGFVTAIVVTVVLGLLNIFIKPVLVFFTIPVTIITLGLFLFVINALIVIFCSHLVSGFRVDGFFSALFFSLLISVLSSFMEWTGKDRRS